MASVRAAAAAGVWLAVAAAPAPAGFLVDFDALPGGGAVAANAPIADQYAALGVTFSAVEDGAPAAGPVAAGEFVGGAGAGNGLFNVQTGVMPQDAGNRADVLRITFARPADGVGFLTDGFLDRTTFRAFGPDGALLETVTNTTGGALAVAFTSTGIGRIDAVQSADDLAFRIDDLRFTPAAVTPVPVPVPPAALAGLAGAAGLGLLGRARRRP